MDNGTTGAVVVVHPQYQQTICLDCGHRVEECTCLFDHYDPDRDVYVLNRDTFIDSIRRGKKKCIRQR